MKHIDRKNATVTTVGASYPPQITVEPGETFRLDTEDAAWGYFRNEQVLPYPEKRPTHTTNPPDLNPVAGPVYINGAQKGDVVAVTVESILPDNRGYTILQPGDGLFGDSVKYRETTDYFTKILQHSPGESGTLRDGFCSFNGTVSWKLRPHIGTICLAPARESHASVSIQGPYGGNIDSRDVAEGSKIYLQSYHEGGLLFAGDVHASMGDGELSDTADECRAEVMLSCDIIKNKRIPHVRIEKPDALIGLFCAKPLEAAVKGAVSNLIDWMTDDYGFSIRDAYLIIGTCSEFRINIYQMVDFPGLSYTVGAELPKRIIEAG